MVKLVVPSSVSNSFNCPHCGALAHQNWFSTLVSEINGAPPLDPYEQIARLMSDATQKLASAEIKPKLAAGDPVDFFKVRSELEDSGTPIDSLFISECYSCQKLAVWLFRKLIYPPARIGPLPNDDMPDDVRKDFEEARSIIDLSPRGAAALLRLCVQKLCKELGQKGKIIDEDIAALVKNGLPIDVQKALDAVRVIGNHAVHPGKLDLRDDRQTVLVLFQIVNFIVEKTIATPKALDLIYKMLPDEQIEEIGRRDNPSLKTKK